MGQLLTRVPVLRSSVMYTRSWLNKMGWKPMKSLQSPCTNTWTRITAHRLVAFLHGNAKDSGLSLRGFLGANRRTEHFPHYLRRGTRTACAVYNFAVILNLLYLVCLPRDETTRPNPINDTSDRRVLQYPYREVVLKVRDAPIPRPSVRITSRD